MKINLGSLERITLIVALVGLLMGFDASVISGVVEFIVPELYLMQLEPDWSVVLLALTATLATVPGIIVHWTIIWELATFGSATTFLIYGVFAAIGLFFIVKVIPETKGKLLVELESILVNK